MPLLKPHHRRTTPAPKPAGKPNAPDTDSAALARIDLLTKNARTLWFGMLATIVLCYKIILKNKNTITTSILYVGFTIDFLTSLYGTASATISSVGEGAILQWGIVIFLSIASTARPILIHQVLEGTGSDL